MSKEEFSYRYYNFSDGLLKQTADGIVLNINRDNAEFVARGVTNARVSAFETKITAFDEAPYDEILQGKVTMATETRDELGEQLKVAIRSVRSIVMNVFGTKKSYYRIYKFERLNNSTPETLHRLARTVVEVATNELINIPELATEGLTQAMIDNVKTKDIAFDASIDNQLAAIRTRDTNTHERIELGNDLYKEMVKLCNIGKDIFASTNESKYNDYVIYNTPTGKAPETGTTGSIRGIATNAITLAPINEVQIYFDGYEEEPIFTDEDGEYLNDIVLVTCNSFVATHPEFQDHTGTFTILPDQEIVLDFSMEPKV